MISSLVLCMLQRQPDPVIVWRRQWHAKPVLKTAIRHTIQRITVHHGGVKSNPSRTLEDKLRGLQAWSQRDDKLAGGKDKPAWPDIPYHFYIAIDGRIGEGRPYWFKGDTNTEYDPTGHLLIMVEGDFEQEEPTEAELKSLEAMLRFGLKKFKLGKESIKTHMDYAQTTCPGKALRAPLQAIIDRLP